MTDLFPNQKQINDNTFATQFLCVHDDDYGREFHTSKDILDTVNLHEMWSNTHIDIISQTNYGINIFLLTIYNDKPISNIFDCDTDLYLFTDIKILCDVYNYEIIPISYKTEICKKYVRR